MLKTVYPLNLRFAVGYNNTSIIMKYKHRTEFCLLIAVIIFIMIISLSGHQQSGY